MSYLVLDTEATDKYPETAEVLSVSIIDSAGTVLLDTLVRPVRETSWPAAQRIHGIRPADVLRPELPTLAELNPVVADIIRGRVVVIYSASYDSVILREAFALGPPAVVHCAMLTYAAHPDVREWNDWSNDWRWQSLRTAARYVGHVWRGAAHTALADCYAARDVWAWLTDAGERARLALAKADQALQLHVDWYLQDKWRFEEECATKSQQRRNEAWELAHYPAMGVREARELLPRELRAEYSADVFCRHLTGYPVRVWNAYGKKLKLKRYGPSKLYGQQVNLPPPPPHLVTREQVHLLWSFWEPETYWPFEEDREPAPIQPAAMLQKNPDFPNAEHGNSLTPLFSLRKMVLGVDYVPFTRDFPEGYYSKSRLLRDFHVKEKDLPRPRYLQLRDRHDNYLLYPYSPPAAEPTTAPDKHLTVTPLFPVS